MSTHNLLSAIVEQIWDLAMEATPEDDQAFETYLAFSNDQLIRAEENSAWQAPWD